MGRATLPFAAQNDLANKERPCPGGPFWACRSPAQTGTRTGAGKALRVQSAVRAQRSAGRAERANAVPLPVRGQVLWPGPPAPEPQAASCSDRQVRTACRPPAPFGRAQPSGFASAPAKRCADEATIQVEAGLSDACPGGGYAGFKDVDRRLRLFARGFRCRTAACETAGAVKLCPGRLALCHQTGK